MMLNKTEERGENLVGNPPPLSLKISRNTNFERKLVKIVCYYYASVVSWFFCAGEPMNPNNMLVSRGIFLFGIRTIHSTESEI